MGRLSSAVFEVIVPVVIVFAGVVPLLPFHFHLCFTSLVIMLQGRVPKNEMVVTFLCSASQEQTCMKSM